MKEVRMHLRARAFVRESDRFLLQQRRVSLDYITTVVKYRRAQQEKQKLWSERTPPPEVFVLTCFEVLVRI